MTSFLDKRLKNWPILDCAVYKGWSRFGLVEVCVSWCLFHENSDIEKNIKCIGKWAQLLTRQKKKELELNQWFERNASTPCSQKIWLASETCFIKIAAHSALWQVPSPIASHAGWAGTQGPQTRLHWRELAFARFFDTVRQQHYWITIDYNTRWSVVQ